MSVALADAFEKEDLREGVCDEALVVADDMKGRGKSIGLLGMKSGVWHATTQSLPIELFLQ